MTSQTGSLSLKCNKARGTNKENGINVTNGSLSVRLVKGKEAAHLCNLAFNKHNRPNGHIFIVFDKTETSEEPVAYCSITDDSEMRRGILFESSNCFRTETLIKRYPDKHFLEISTFQVLNEKKAHRARGLLWQAITSYCEQKSIDYVLGCFSFGGKYPAQYAFELSYLYHFCQAEPDLQVAAHQGISMDIMPIEAIKPDAAFRFLPPLLRYCLRLGAKVSDAVVVNKHKMAIDVFLLIPAHSIKISAF